MCLQPHHHDDDRHPAIDQRPAAICIGGACRWLQLQPAPACPPLTLMMAGGMRLLFDGRWSHGGWRHHSSGPTGAGGHHQQQRVWQACGYPDGGYVPTDNKSASQQAPPRTLHRLLHHQHYAVGAHSSQKQTASNSFNLVYAHTQQWRGRSKQLGSSLLTKNKTNNRLSNISEFSGAAPGGSANPSPWNRRHKGVQADGVQVQGRLGAHLLLLLGRSRNLGVCVVVTPTNTYLRIWLQQQQ